MEAIAKINKTEAALMIQIQSLNSLAKLYNDSKSLSFYNTQKLTTLKLLFAGYHRFGHLMHVTTSKSKLLKTEVFTSPIINRRLRQV
jgi:hypothetical protein